MRSGFICRIVKGSLPRLQTIATLSLVEPGAERCEFLAERSSGSGLLGELAVEGIVDPNAMPTTLMEQPGTYAAS